MYSSHRIKIQVDDLNVMDDCEPLLSRERVARIWFSQSPWPICLLGGL